MSESPRSWWAPLRDSRDGVLQQARGGGRSEGPRLIPAASLAPPGSPSPAAGSPCPPPGHPLVADPAHCGAPRVSWVGSAAKALVPTRLACLASQLAQDRTEVASPALWPPMGHPDSALTPQDRLVWQDPGPAASRAGSGFPSSGSQSRMCPLVGPRAQLSESPRPLRSSLPVPGPLTIYFLPLLGPGWR